MNWFHEVKLEVRAYELDQFDSVNNAVYANFCQYGQFDLCDKIGMEIDNVAIKELSLKYIAPLRRRDKFVLKVRICELYGARMCFEILIFKLPNLEPILEAKSTVVWLDKNHRPTRIPPEMASKFKQYLVNGYAD
ncbi:hypothetical protein CDL12_26379 [Handroanthus impetiginosus]|uniref:Uncharacterized protein n=1 Tax=Handroanthus impetiginosus TaxID=429701 RepID=A0A2G9G725_9LAMI|nr:hypothetical protein CDL12_26379 [Handroanthus impetiginosus]